MNKIRIAEILEEIHTLLELKGENPFKIRAYQTAARALESLEKDLGSIIDNEGLDSIKGIGPSLAEKIEILYRTGKLDYYDTLKASIDPGLIEMLSIPGLGPKKIKALHDKLGIHSLEELETACTSGKIEKLKGFGAKTQENILTGIKNRKLYSQRHLWWDANQIVTPILDGLRKLPEVKKADVAGSLRRKAETIGDLDLVVASEHPHVVMDWFTSQPHVQEVLAKGETKSSIRLEGGLQADLRVVPLKQYYFALHHFTGSKDHNIKMRKRALSSGYSLSEWGLKNIKHPEEKPVEINSEKALFKFLGLHFIEPELREGLDEIDLAEKGELPRLVEPADIKGVFHNHTTASDGKNTLDEMAAAAQAIGWQYIGIADHSKGSFHASGLSENLLLDQVDAIKKLNKSKKFKIHIFSGVECDILKDGSMDYDDDILKQLDCVVASVHSSLSLTEDEMTKRIIKAIENPYVKIIAHLTGRLLLKREGYSLNIPKVIDAAIANNVIIELNAHPRRLDMDWRYWKNARDKGLKCCINPDAHSTSGLEFYTAGVNIARKGWLRKEDVINTLSLKEIMAYFA